MIRMPIREYIVILFLIAALGIDFFLRGSLIGVIFFVSVIAVIPTGVGAAQGLIHKKVTIDVFNIFAVVITIITHEVYSFAFIALMLSCARILDWYTETRTKDAVQELLKLKPLRAFLETGDSIQEVPVESIRVGDVLVIKNGDRVPVDGRIIFGSAFVNQASVTGEPIAIEKIIGDEVISSTVVESGVIKIKAERVGSDSTIERIAQLMRDAASHKGRAEKIADRFAGIFLPAIGLFGLIVYLVSHDIKMVAALFLVACADDMAVALPLAITASLGYAAKRGVIIKGGEWIEALARSKVVIFDKTGTITTGNLAVKDVEIASGFSQDDFWKSVGSAEKFSEHLLGRAIFHEAYSHVGPMSDPLDVTVIKGGGILAHDNANEVLIGNEKIIHERGCVITQEVRSRFETKKRTYEQTTVFVYINAKYAGMITVGDTPRAEAAASIKHLRNLGCRRIIMFTGDNEAAAASISSQVGIEEYRASMTPEAKMIELEAILSEGPVMMVGDGINDAPALARADVGIAMGRGGTAVAVDAAQVVIVTDNLERLPECIELARRTMSVVKSDIAIWAITNCIGFALVLTGVAGIAFAAFYNFVTDFLPLINSSRLFISNKKRRAQ